MVIRAFLKGIKMKPEKMKPLLLCGLLALLFVIPGPSIAQTSYAAWSDSQRIYINTTSAGANVVGAVTNFPLLIRLNPSNFTRFSRTKPLGADIRFATSSGVHLNYQIERWKDGANDADSAEIWVKVPSVTGNNNTQFIRMYYGNTSAVDSSKSRLVFDTANGFIGVWHLAEDPNGGAAGAIKDASANSLNATSRGSMTSNDLVDGVIGKGHDFDGTDDADSIPYGPALNTANAVTLSAWVKLRTFQSYSRIITRGVTSNINPWTVYSLNTNDTNHRWRGEESSGDSNSQKSVLGKNNLIANTWYHVTFTYNKTNLLLYTNGVQDSVSIAATNALSTSLTTPLMIGKSNYATNPLNGVIDEAIVSKVARSGDWIKLSYETQRPAAGCVRVQVAAVPVITTEPTGLSVAAGTSASMTVKASVTAGSDSVFRYEWYKTSVASGNIVSGQTTATLSFPNVQTTDGGIFYCVVHNEYGADTSMGAALTVTSSNSPPTITTQPQDVSVLENTQLTLTVGANGTMPLSFKWYMGSTLVGTANPFSVSAARSTDAGSYFCIVSNDFGACTSRTAKVTISPNKAVSNPIMLSGLFRDSTHVRLSVMRYSGLLTSAPDQFFTWDPDTVMIWYQATTYPPNPVPAQVKFKISKARLTAMGGDKFDTLVTVTKLTGCNPYYFKASVKWKSTAQPAAKDSIPRFGDSLSGAKVVMCDTVKLLTPLTMNFQYTAPSDSVVVTITGLAAPSIQWDLITQLVLRYTVPGVNPIDVQMNPATIRGGNTYMLPVKNTRFSGDSAGVNWQLFFKGVNNNKSDTVKAVSSIGVNRPPNTLTLFTSEVQATQVTLGWTNSGTPYDSFRVWYATTPVPDSNISLTVYSHVTVSGALTATLIRSLKDSTTYFFGIQGQRSGGWSYIPKQAKTSAITPKDTSQAIPNTMRIFAVLYDSVSAKMRIAFRIENLGFQHRFGFTWLQRDSLPRPLPLEFIIEPSSSPQEGEIDFTDKLGQMLTYEFDLANTTPLLEYGKPYYFGGWVSKVNEKWATPTDSSIFYYTIPQPKVVPLRIFPDHSDAAMAFGNQVVLRKVDDVDMSVILRIVDGLPFTGSDLVPVSIAFKFDSGFSQIRLLTGLAYNSSLPLGTTKSDIRMYHYDATRKVWLIDTAKIIEDAVSPVLYVQKYLSDCKYPFVLAVDMKVPTITVTGDTSSALSFEDSIPMTVQVDDNIANPIVALHAGQGDLEMSHHDTLKTAEVISGVARSWNVPSEVVQGECGIRVNITANDGRYSVVADVSRDVTFEKSDDTKPVMDEWSPLGATGVLDSPSVKKALNEYTTEDGAWKYDIYQLRLFRYIKKAWLEYSEAKQDSFIFTPSRVIWLKTRKDNAIELGSGRSVSLKSPYTIRLPAKSWTDFCLPYRFDIRIGDVLAACNATEISGMQFYQWSKPSHGGRYTAKEFYLPGNMNVGKVTDTLFYRRSNDDKAAYTVWNDQTSDVVLRIPGTPLVYSRIGTSVLKNTGGGGRGWSVAVRSSASDGELSPVFCAYVAGGEGTITYPCPPSWSKVNVGIFDRDRSEVYGNVITRELKNGGYTYELVFENGLADRTRVNYTVERLAADNDVEIAVIDPTSGAIVAGESPLSIDVGGSSRAYRLLAIGTSGYIDRFGRDVKRGSFTLRRITPNPCRGRVIIEFTVPYGGIERVRCDMLDHRGRVLWSAQPERQVNPGENSITWTPYGTSHPAAGAYFLRLTGYDGKGRKTGEQLTKILFLR
jgi:hypothetical protein